MGIAYNGKVIVPDCVGGLCLDGKVIARSPDSGGLCLDGETIVKVGGAPKQYALVSTGTQWIDTGVSFDSDKNNSIKMEVKLQLIGNERVLHGSGAFLNQRFYFGRSSTAETAVWQVGIGASATTNTNDRIDYNIHTFIYEYNGENSQWKLWKNGVLLLAEVYKLSRTNSIFLFAAQSTTGGVSYRGNQKVFGARYWIDNILVRDFISVPAGDTTYSITPAPSNCMWDKVTQQYFVNQGTGEFGIEEITG